MSLIGLELTFVPDLKGSTKEFSSFKRATRVAAQLNERLNRLDRIFLLHNVGLVAKAERFRRCEDNLSEFRAWIIEVNNGDSPTQTYQWEDPRFVRLIQAVFNEARKLKLYPRIRRRGVHHGAGGSHLHFGIADLFADDHEYLKRLGQFERSLYCDYANRPYIRWLFSEWFDIQENSRVIYGLDSLSDDVVHTPENTHDWGLSNNSISRRFSSDGKPSYSTYEFRLFDMGDTAKDIALHVAFVNAWIKSHQLLVATGYQVGPVLTKAAFKRFRNVRYAWKTISTFLTELKLDPQDYRHFFEENYIPRMRHGSMT